VKVAQRAELRRPGNWQEQGSKRGQKKAGKILTKERLNDKIVFAARKERVKKEKATDP